MKFSKWLLAIAMAAMVALTGCGGGSSDDNGNDDDDTPPVTPSIIGAWNAATFFVPTQNTTYPNGPMFSGTYTFNADGTYGSTLQVNGAGIQGGTWWLTTGRLWMLPYDRPEAEELTFSVTETVLTLVLLNQTNDGTLTFTFTRM